MFSLMPRLTRFAFVVPVLLLSVAGQAWIDTGHMVVATIAQSRLSPSVSKEIDRLLAIGGDERNADFVTTSPWADDVRSQRRETGPWHYIDYHFRTDGKPTANKPDKENVVWAIQKFSAVLKDRSKPDAERSEALRFLIHFVGDIHQPLHSSDRDSDEHPDGDRGGNEFPIVAPSIFDTVSRPPRNLHAFWDFAGGLYQGERRPLSSASKARIDALALQLTTHFPERSLSKARDMNPNDWALESLQISKTFVYTLQEGSTPSEEYVKKAQEISGERLTLAGYRLARLLNSLLG